MIIFVVALALSGQTASLPLPAAPSTPSLPPAVPRVVEAADASGSESEERRAGRPLVCRNETVLGSRFPVRRCRPANLTPQERALAADQLRRQQTLNMRADGSSF